MGMPALIGAGIGGGLNLIRGKSLGGILQGAALGGAGGALTGGINNYIDTGSIFGANALGQQIAKDAMISNAAQGIGQGAIANGVTTPWGTTIDPTEYAFANTAYPIYTGGQGVFSNAMGDITSAIPSAVKDYATPQNLLGVAALATQDTKAPSMALGGGASVRGGQAPQYQGFPLATSTSWQKKVGY